MDLKNMKVSIGIVIAIVAQAFGIIWYVAQLDSTVSNLDSSVAAIQEDATTVDVALLEKSVETLKESITQVKEDLESEQDTRHSTLDDLFSEYTKVIDRISELELTQGIIENEMRTIMSDHESIGKALEDLGKGSSAENRKYGNYGGQ